MAPGTPISNRHTKTRVQNTTTADWQSSSVANEPKRFNPASCNSTA